MTSTLQKWPKDWNIHVLKYCDLYFHGKAIQFVDKDFWGKSLLYKKSGLKVDNMNLKFKIGDHHYLVGFENCGGSHFVCNIFYRKIVDLTTQDPNDLHISCLDGCDFALLEDIAGLGGGDLDLKYLMDFAESMMWADHRRRNDDGWDNDDDDGENNPVEPISPTEVVEPELTLV
jgi:hypothetical protein